MERYYIYCDASFCKKYQLAILGFLLFGDKNYNCKISHDMLYLKKISEKNNIRAELKGMIWALETLKLKLKYPIAN